MNGILKECLDKMEKSNIRCYSAQEPKEYNMEIVLTSADDFITFCTDNKLKNVFYSVSSDDSCFQLFTDWNTQGIGYIYGESISQNDDEMDNDYEEMSRFGRFNEGELQSKEQLKELLKDKDKLKKELAIFLIEHSNMVYGKKNISYYDNSMNFLRTKDIDTNFLYGSKEYDEFWKISKKLATDLQKKIDDEYMNNIWSLVDDCVEKYRKRGKITKGEVSLFFSENNIIASGSIKDMFHAKVNGEIQKNLYT